MVCVCVLLIIFVSLYNPIMKFVLHCFIHTYDRNTTINKYHRRARRDLLQEHIERVRQTLIDNKQQKHDDRY